MFEILSQNAITTLTLISVGISFVISALYRLTLDREKMERVKKETEDFRKKMEKAKKDGDQKEVNKYMNQMMKVSQKQMKMNFKPMIYTFIIIIPIFFFFFPNVYGDAKIGLQGENEKFTGKLVYQGFSKDLEVRNSKKLEVNINGKTIEKGDIFTMSSYKFEVRKLIENNEKKKLKLSRVIAELPLTLPFIGKTLGWLGWYILISIPFTQFFRKMLGVA